MKRFYFSSVNILLLSIFFSFLSCHKDDGGGQNTTTGTPAGHFPEDFEYGSKSSYSSGEVTLNSGTWYFEDAVIGSSAIDKKDGSQAARLENAGKISMRFDKSTGADTVFVSHGVFGSDDAGTWELWMSTDSGNSWNKEGSTVTAANVLTKQTFLIKQKGNVRFEIRKTSGGTNRINIDDIRIGDYTGNITTPVPGDDDNMLMGNPSNATADVLNANNYLMVKPQYCLSYSNAKLTPNWTSWHVTSTDLGSTTRQDDYRADTSLPSGWYEAGTSEYSGSGFDRGHMCPSGDRTSSVANNSPTFLMTNMVPQAPNNNQVTWENLESYCRTLVTAGNELYIISGPYGQGGTGSNGFASTVGHGVVVPAQVWKIVVVLTQGNDDLNRITSSTRVIAVLMPNTQTVSSQPWGYYRVSIDQIETLTGFDFLSNVSASVQSVIEARVDNGPTQ